MAHNSHDHHHEADAKTVIFSLFLFFAITVAGHYVFVLQPHGPSSETARILGDHNAEKEKPHAAGKHE